MPQPERKARSASSRGASTTPRQYTVRTRASQSTAAHDAPAARSAQPQGHAADFSAYRGWRMLLNPIWCYHGFALCVFMLMVFGLVMVFSSSSVSMVAVGATPWSQALDQAKFCIIGLVAFAVTLALPYRAYAKFCTPLVAVAGFMQLLTLTPLGVEVNGNKGWINLGFATFQPAELVKFVLCITLPKLLVEVGKRHERGAPTHIKDYLWTFGTYGALLVLVLAGRDLGTTMILVFIGLVAFCFSDFPRKWLGVFAVGLAGACVLFAIMSPNRMRRILATYQGCSASDMQDACYQATHAKYALASGGFLGVGLGNSREKWNYLPEAHNDFIYAIIGEETGFVGAVLVLVLFAVIAWCMIVVALRTPNRYTSMALLCFTVWIVGQALVNIAVVVGILPVMGVPLPFVSAGGSSLILCLAAAGASMSMMRSQPQIAAERQRS